MTTQTATPGQGMLWALQAVVDELRQINPQAGEVELAAILGLTVGNRETRPARPTFRCAICGRDRPLAKLASNGPLLGPVCGDC